MSTTSAATLNGTRARQDVESAGREAQALPNRLTMGLERTSLVYDKSSLSLSWRRPTCSFNRDTFTTVQSECPRVRKRSA
jgi:hypothetical protein